MGMIVRMTGELVGNMGDTKGSTHKQHGEHHQNITLKKGNIMGTLKTKHDNIFHNT
jgi:hypothetical protein